MCAGGGGTLEERERGAKRRTTRGRRQLMQGEGVNRIYATSTNPPPPPHLLTRAPPPPLLSAIPLPVAQVRTITINTPSLQQTSFSNTNKRIRSARSCENLQQLKAAILDSSRCPTTTTTTTTTTTKGMYNAYSYGCHLS